jgi:hypothetical protein
MNELMVLLQGRGGNTNENINFFGIQQKLELAAT